MDKTNGELSTVVGEPNCDSDLWVSGETEVGSAGEQPARDKIDDLAMIGWERNLRINRSHREVRMPSKTHR